LVRIRLKFLALAKSAFDAAAVKVSRFGSTVLPLALTSLA